MKIIRKTKYIIIIFNFIILVTTGCNDPITEFGFDGKLSGKIMDSSDGSTIHGDITSGSFIVNALGENDEVSMVMRVQGDGTFANSKLYPQMYEVWVVGPFLESPSERITIDLNGGKEVIHNFELTPLLSISTPELEGIPSSNEITLRYSISGNDGHVTEQRELYCSTVKYPSASTGSGPGWHTVSVSLSGDQNTVTIPDLESGTRYFIRIGAKATDSDAWNYGDQIEINTP